MKQPNKTQGSTHADMFTSAQTREMFISSFSMTEHSILLLVGIKLSPMVNILKIEKLSLYLLKKVENILLSV